MAILLARYLGPVTDQEAGVAGEFIFSLRDDLYHELFGHELASGHACASELSCDSLTSERSSS